MNSNIDTALAETICSDNRFLEVIVAPSFDDAAVDLLAQRWQNIRLLAVGPLTASKPRELVHRTIPGGLLLQERDAHPTNPDDFQVKAGPPPSPMPASGRCAA